MKITKSAWPILIVSQEFNRQTDDGFQINEIIKQLENVQHCSVIRSFRYEDAAELFM